MRAAHRHGGFTLVEMVVSLTLLSMLVVATLGALRTLGDTQSRLEDVSERVDEMRQVSGYLRRTLGQTVAISRMQLGQPLGPYFWGSEQEVIWVAPSQAGWGGLHVHRLFLSEEEELRVQFDSYRGPDIVPRWDDLESHILLRDVQELRLEYRHPQQSDWAAGDWAPEWEIQSPGPTHLRLHLVVRERNWPTLVFAFTGWYN